MMIRDIPHDYTLDAARPGRITKIEYDNGRETKYAIVYLPYSYDDREKYDILYLIHGAREDRRITSATRNTPPALKK